jgi:glucose-6-phosphate isomerase
MAEPVLDRQDFALGPHGQAVEDRLRALDAGLFTSRLWQGDPTLWTADPKGQAAVREGLGWLRSPDTMQDNLSDLAAFADEARRAGFRHVVHMGMGGSSLAPLVFERSFRETQTPPRANGGASPRHAPPLTVLDTTDPATILAIERTIPLTHTLFIVASKSGTTAEPLAFGEYFYARLRKLKGDRAGDNFVAITDPDTPLVALGRERRYRRIFLNFRDVGGRYSGLSYFGLVPAALAGVDLAELLERSRRMARACASGIPARDNPGVALGAAMGELAKRGRDKVTLLVSPPVATLGMWLEQLMAESTGKDGTGLLPVADEPLGTPSVYGEDRLFAYVRLEEAGDGRLERGIAALREAGHPVVTIRMHDPLDLGQEFFRWEIATATAGAILGINAFDQPNVQESKDNTNRLLGVVRTQGRLPEETPTASEGRLRIYAGGTGAADGRRDPGRGESVVAALARFLEQARPGNYVALQAYLTEDAPTDRALTQLRLRIRDRTRLATTVGYGPRYLHSTGQYHKGGPNTGLFFQLTADDTVDADVPGAPYTFGVFKRAQAQGDLEALRAHGRRVMRVHLGADAARGLEDLDAAVAAALEAVG